MAFFKKLFGLSSDKGGNMKVVIGLGNPGEKYQATRHNIGWMVLDALAGKHGAPAFKENKKLKSATSEVRISGKKVVLVKPLTFMNKSGDSASAIKNFYKLSNEDFLIIYDDIDLPIGELRFRTSGGAGTHNGMKSMIQHFGQEFARLRCGIENRPADLKAKIDLSDYVLGRFTKNEENTVQKQIEEAVHMIEEKT